MTFSLYPDHSEGVVVQMWDAKAAVHTLAKAGLGCVSGRVEDPRVAVWLLNPDTKQSNLHNMVSKYFIFMLLAFVLYCIMHCTEYR